MPRRSIAALCVMVFVAALLARGVWGGYRLARAHDPTALEFPDEEQYWLMATSLHGGQGLKDEFGFRATRMPLYPAALSLVADLRHGVIVAKMAQWLVGALAAAITVVVATNLFGRRVGVVAGLWVAFDPFLVFFSSLLLTETIFCAVLLGLWWVVLPVIYAPPTDAALDDFALACNSYEIPERKLPAGKPRACAWGSDSHSRGTPGVAHAAPGRWIAIGIMAALCVYIRESSVGLVAVLLGLVLICRGFDRRTLIGVALTCLVVVIALVPWAIRNHRLTGSWCWLTHRAGVSLYDGVGPQADGSSNLGDIQQMDVVRGLDEVAWNRYFLEESISSIRDDPARIARLAGTKLWRTWNPFPNIESYQSRFVRIVSGAWTIPTFALAVVGVILLPRVKGGSGVRAALLLLLPALYTATLHTLFVGSVRYRLTAMPMLEMLAAFALVRCFTSFATVRAAGLKPARTREGMERSRQFVTARGLTLDASRKGEQPAARGGADD